MFKLHSNYKPTGDQPQAIENLVNGIKNGCKEQTLLGVTGSGKTFTIANIIEQVQKLLGHVQIDTTMQYAMVNQSNVKIAHRKFIG